MLKTKLLIAATAAMLIAGPTAGFAQTQPDPHHPGQNPAGAAGAPIPQAPGMPMMDMRAMMNMMNMMGGRMGMGGMSGSCMDGMGMAGHVEGRIAFLRAELKITGEQGKLWDGFAEALRANARRAKDQTAGSMMSGGAKGFLGQIESQEKMLTERLDSVKAMRAALVPLAETFSEEQRKAAEELLGPRMGMMGAGMMGAGMMQGGAAQGGMMQGDTAQPQTSQ